MNFKKHLLLPAYISLLSFSGRSLIGSYNNCDKEELLPLGTPVSEEVICSLQNINEKETEISLIIDNKII